VVVDSGEASDVAALTEAMSACAAPGTRVEWLVLDDPAVPQRRAAFEELGARGLVAKFVPRSGVDRALVLDALTVPASKEFVVVCDDPGLLRSLGGALAVLWVEGADAALVQRGASGDDGGRVEDSVRLTQGLRLAPGHPGPALVVMRRWVARWLLTEIDRSLDPAAELVERGRLLGLTLVELPAD
jgi:hypothetical protein